LIHGKQSLNTAGAGDATFGESADALEGQGSSQALIVDWSSGAASSILDLSQGRYFVPLGKKMKQLLARKRLNGPSEFSVLGHSWGTLVGHEFAAQFKRKIDRFVALDPAREAFGGYDDGRVNFKDRAKSSWSFVAVQGIFGDEKKARTAEHAVAVEFSPVSNLDLFSRYLVVHGAVVQMFEEMIDECYGSSAQPDNISAKMKPALSGYVPKWKKNRFNQSGETKPWMKGKNRFEAFMKCDLFDKNGKFKKLDSAKFVNESGNEKILTR
jgi:pimeloyl-ACP methyl ester carboxylesterase